MAVPLNTHDFGRFKALADFLREQGTKVEISIYVGSQLDGDSYISLEMKGYGEPTALAEIFND